MRIIPILNALRNVPEIARFVPYMMDNTLRVEKKFPGLEGLSDSGYNMAGFATDNQLVMSRFSQLQQGFNQWRGEKYKTPIAPINIEPTGSRSFGASYTESDLECAVVSENFDDFLDFCRFLNTNYNHRHTFTALKTLAGLPLLIIKGEAGFCCPMLSHIYPGKTLPQLEVTFRHPSVHQIIQGAGHTFFAELTPEELESYVVNKRYIELMFRDTPVDATFEGEPLKKGILETFKSTLSKPLKCLPPGKLQDTPDFNKQVFAEAIKPTPILSNAIELGMTLYKPHDSNPDKSQPGNTLTL